MGRTNDFFAACFAEAASVLRHGDLRRQWRPDQTPRRVVIEKPFGHDLAAAKALNAPGRDREAIRLLQIECPHSNA
jgi:glucose-6-phosphate 1-dehydrogenase